MSKSKYAHSKQGIGTMPNKDHIMAFNKFVQNQQLRIWTMAIKTNSPSLNDMVLEYKLGRTNQVTNASSSKAELAAFKCEAVAATSKVTSTLPHSIQDGLKKGPVTSLLHQPKDVKLDFDQGWTLERSF
ncbi:unnamed protein product [Camellia sinensis]